MNQPNLDDINKLLSNETNTDSDLIKSLNILVNEKFLEGKTILDNRQVTAISLMYMYGQIYDIPFLKDFVETWTRYRISGDDGRGRKEIIEIAKAIQQALLEKDNKFIDALNKR